MREGGRRSARRVEVEAENECSQRLREPVRLAVRETRIVEGILKRERMELKLDRESLDHRPV